MSGYTEGINCFIFSDTLYCLVMPSVNGAGESSVPSMFPDSQKTGLRIEMPKAKAEY